MFDLQYEPSLNPINPTSKRVFASRPINFSSKENDVKAHSLFLQESSKRRALIKLYRLKEEYSFIEKRFQDINEKFKDIRDRLIKLVNLQNGIIQNVSEKYDLTNFLLFTTKNHINKIESENILFENDSKQIQEDISKIVAALSVENKIGSLLKDENVNFKCNLTRIKAEHTKMSSHYAKISKNFESKKDKFNLLLKDKEKLELYQFRMDSALDSLAKDVINKKQAIPQLEGEYFIKKRVSFKLLKDNGDFLQSSNNFTDKTKNEFSQSVSGIRSKIFSTQHQNSQLKEEISKIRADIIQSMTINVDLEHQKDELITMNQYLSEIANNLQEDEIKNDSEIANLKYLIDQANKENECLDSNIEEFGETKFKQQILANEKSQQWDQCITYINNEIDKIKNQISLIKSRKK